MYALLRSPPSSASGILFVELVGAHDAVDLPAIAVGIEVCDRRPETRDLEHHLGAVIAQEIDIMSGLVVVPDVVEDGGVDVTLVVREVRIPRPRERVDVDQLRLLLAVASALPRIHRPAVAGLLRAGARLADPPVAIHQQASRDLRQTEVQKRIHVELVPEDVTAVRLTVQSTGRDAGVVMRRQSRAHLQQMRDVQAKQELHPPLSGQPHVADLPQLIPSVHMAFERLGERRVAVNALASVGHRIVDRTITRRVHAHHLFDANSRVLLDLEIEAVLDVVLHLIDASSDVKLLSAPVHARAGRLRDLDPRLPCADLQRDHVIARRARAFGIKMAAPQLVIPRNSTIQHTSVQDRQHLDWTRPILGNDLPFERAQMHPTHAHEPTAPQTGLPAGAIPKSQLTPDKRVSNVVAMPVGQELDIREADRILILDTELQGETPREVDKVLVGHGTPAHDRRFSVINAMRVRAGIVHVAGVLPLRGTPNAEVPIPRRGERLTQPLV